MRPRPLRHRLLAAMISTVIVALALASVVVHVLMRRALVANLDLALDSIALTEIASAIDEPGGKLHVHDPPPLQGRSAAHGHEKMVHIEDARGTVMAHTPNVTGDRLPVPGPVRDRAMAGEPTYADVEVDGHGARALARRLDAPGGPYLVVVALSCNPLEAALAALAEALALVLVIAVLVAAAVARVLAARLTRPLEHIATAAGAVGAAGSAARSPLTGTELEVDELAGALNRMLDRLEAAAASERAGIERQHRFLQDASHELRSPLANLRGVLEVGLRRDRAPAEYRDMLTEALAEAERLSRMVHALLTLSRADAGKLELERTPCDLVEIARQSVEAHTARAAESGVRLIVAGAGSAPLSGAPERLRQVFDNLVDNALRYAPAASAVTITLTAGPPAVRAVIADEGPGLHPGMHGRLFERFARGDPSRERGSGGTGLGLAIARALIEAHGGTIARVASERGLAIELALPVP